jgi:signal transduction histidine kinase
MPEHSLDTWERRVDKVVTYMPFVALAVSTGLTILTFLPEPTRYWVALGALVVLAALWNVWFVHLHPGWSERRGIVAVFYAGLMVLTFLLIALSPWFGFYALAGYLYALALLPGRWKIAGVVCSAILAGMSQTGGLPRSSGQAFAWAIAAVLNTIISGSFIFAGWVSENQGKRRTKMIDDLNEANRNLEAALAENAGLHAQLLRSAREAGVSEERRRMAGEIHDTLAQGLTGIITQLEAAEQAAGRPGDWRRHLDHARRLARESLTEARRSVQAIGPGQLDGAALPEALRDVAERWSAEHGVPVERTTTGTARPLHPEVEAALLRTAQEALANVARHARAGRVGLTLSYMEDLVTLDVRDDGAGFDPETVPAGNGDGGYGLRGMRQRVLRLAGELTIESDPGTGTAVYAALPAVPR